MMDKYGFKIAKAMNHISEVKWFWGLLDQNLRIGDPQTYLEPTSRARVQAVTKAALDSVREVCKLTGLERVEPELGRLEQLIWPPDGIPIVGGTATAAAIAHLISRLQDELNERHFVRVTDASLYDRPDLFGHEVAKKFKTAVSDIENAGNCVALEQGTACVFHLMRAMEVAVRQLSKRLKVTITPQTTWRQMTNLMDDKIKKMPERTEHLKRKKNDWEAARTNLHHVGSVWRNNTMHPASSYTPSQAADVLRAVHVFMTALADL